MKKFYDVLSQSSAGRPGNLVDGKLWRSCCTFLMIVLCCSVFTDVNAAHVKVTGDFSSVDFSNSAIEEAVETDDGFQNFFMMPPTINCVALNIGLNSGGLATLGWEDFTGEDGTFLCPDGRALSSAAPAGSFTIDQNAGPFGANIPEITYNCNALGTHDLTATVDCVDGADLCWNTITIEDKIAPYICCPDNITIECDVDNDANPLPFAGWNGPLHSDDIPGASGLANFPITSPYDELIGFGPCPVPPTFLCPIIIPGPADCAAAKAGSDDLANAALGYTGLPYVEENDECGGFTLTYADVLIGYSPSEHDCENHDYSIERTWTATDASGNASSCVQIITIEDTTDPVFTSTPSTPVYASCDSFDPGAPFPVTAEDNCYLASVVMTVDLTGSPVPYPGPIPNNDGPAGECITHFAERIWRATDACGNFTTFQQEFFIYDDAAPVLSPITYNDDDPATAGIQVYTGNDCSADVAFTLDATDNCDDELDYSWSFTFTPADGFSSTCWNWSWIRL